MKKCIYIFLVSILIICSIQKQGITQSREVSFEPFLLPSDGWVIGGNLNYYIPMGYKSSIGVKAFYATNKWQKHSVYDSWPIINYSDISLVYRRRTTNRPNRRFHYEYGLSSAHISKKFPPNRFIFFCGTGFPLYYLERCEEWTKEYTSYSLLLGITTGFKYDIRIFKNLFFGLKLDVQYLYDFHLKETMPGLKPTLSFSYEF